MAIVKMKRLQLLALRPDREALLRRLQSLGCVEIREPDIESFSKFRLLIVVTY